MAQRVAGIFNFQIDGVLRNAKGSFTYNLGQPKREMVIGADRVHGYKETVQAPSLEGEITDSPDINLESEILNRVDGTATLELANGKSILFRGLLYTGDGNVGTEDANIQIMFSADSAEEV